MTNSEVQDERFAFLTSLEETNTDGVSFTSGAPGTAALKGIKDILLKATTETLNEDADIDGLFKYGPEQGCETFCTELAHFLTSQYDSKVHSSNLMVTAGATQGLHLVLSVLCDKSATILVEDPTYFIALRIFHKDLNLKVVPVPGNDTGPDLDLVEDKLKTLQSKGGSRTKNGLFRVVIYLVSVFGNPTGYVYSAEKNRRMIDLARKYDALIITDDVYNLLWFPPTGSTNLHDLSATPPRLLTYDKSTDAEFGGGHVISVGTFSKFLAPSVRLGWLEAPQPFIQQLCNSGLALSGGSFNHYVSKLVTWALKSGLLSQHLMTWRMEYAKRMNKMCEMLDKHLPDGFKYTRPLGGFFLWLIFPPNVDTYEFLHFAAERYGILFIPGIFFSPTDGCHNCARLSVSNNEISALETGVKELCMAFSDYCMMG